MKKILALISLGLLLFTLGCPPPPAETPDNGTDTNGTAQVNDNATDQATDEATDGKTEEAAPGDEKGEEGIPIDRSGSERGGQ